MLRDPQPFSSAQFQFTRPIRAAILRSGARATGTHGFQFTRPIRAAISNIFLRYKNLLFQFTRPIRAAMSCLKTVREYLNISIHATHTGRDSWVVLNPAELYDFNSRDPYGPRYYSVR